MSLGDRDSPKAKSFRKGMEGNPQLPKIIIGAHFKAYIYYISYSHCCQALIRLYFVSCQSLTIMFGLAPESCARCQARPGATSGFRFLSSSSPSIRPTTLHLLLMGRRAAGLKRREDDDEKGGKRGRKRKAGGKRKRKGQKLCYLATLARPKKV